MDNKYKFEMPTVLPFSVSQMTEFDLESLIHVEQTYGTVNCLTKTQKRL